MASEIPGFKWGHNKNAICIKKQPNDIIQLCRDVQFQMKFSKMLEMRSERGFITL